MISEPRVDLFVPLPSSDDSPSFTWPRGHQSGGSAGMSAHVSDIKLVNWSEDGYLTQDRSVGVTYQRTKKCN